MPEERDYPKGHPAAADYAGEPYTPPQTFSHDFPEGHPARGGKNTNPTDTPDGFRKFHNDQERKRRVEIAPADEER